jgi:hypothetical protein
MITGLGRRRDSVIRLLAVCFLLLAASGCWLLFSLDTTPPAVEIVTPRDGSYVSGSVTLAASASDSSGVKSLQFYVDNSLLGDGVPNGSVYSCAWNTDGLALNSQHTIYARAVDSSDNTGYSDTVTVTVAAGHDFSIYSGSFTAQAGYYTYIWFNASANDSILGDARSTSSSTLTDFFWCDSVNFVQFQNKQSFTALDRQQNQTQVSVSNIIPATGKYYLVFQQSSSSPDLVLWVRFLLRRWQ